MHPMHNLEMVFKWEAFFIQFLTLAYACVAASVSSGLSKGTTSRARIFQPDVVRTWTMPAAEVIVEVCDY